MRGRRRDELKRLDTARPMFLPFFFAASPVFMKYTRPRYLTKQDEGRRARRGDERRKREQRVVRSLLALIWLGLRCFSDVSLTGHPALRWLFCSGSVFSPHHSFPRRPAPSDEPRFDQSAFLFPPPTPSRLSQNISLAQAELDSTELRNPN